MTTRHCRMIITILLAAMITLHNAAAQVQPGSADPLRHGHALLIGNSKYVQWPRLDDVPLQLDALAAGLKNHFDTVEVVKDLKIEQLRQKINDFLRSYGNDSNARLLVYYAGHGYTEPILQYNENRGYITGIDTPSIEKGYDAARPMAMSMLEIRVPLAEVLAKHILMIFDSCFAGTIFLTREGNVAPPELTPAVVDRLMERPSRNIITAGRANERVPAHSPIPKLLLSALDGEADPARHGVISAAEINIYLRNQLLGLPAVNLTPQYGRLQDPNFAEGEFLFRVPRPEPIATAAVVPPRAPPAGSAETRISLRPIDRPPPGYRYFSSLAAGPGTNLRLVPVSEKRNSITDDARWWIANRLDPIEYRVPNPLTGSDGNLPDLSPTKLRGRIIVKAIRSDPIIAIYGGNFAEGDYLVGFDAATGAVRFAFDFSQFAWPHEFENTANSSVRMAAVWAVAEGGILYVSHAHNTYARESNGYNAYISAVNMGNGTLLWHSQPLVSNAENFIVKGDAIIAGYGFTAEKDFLNILNKTDGRLVRQIPLRKSAERIVEKKDQLYVRTYDTDYVFRYEQQ
jgi:hypothetical protein